MAFPTDPRSRLTLGAAVAALGAAGLLAAVTDVQILGHWQGLFLLRGKSAGRLELKDDLVLGEDPRVLGGVSFTRVRRLMSAVRGPKAGVPWLELDWDDVDGNGIVRNHLADGTELVTLFSRFVDDDGRVPHGLFVGGALPDVAADRRLQNESGMAFRDERGWHHVWCNVNEAIWDEANRVLSYPSHWTFLGSRVLVADANRVVLESSHETTIDGVPVRIDRSAMFMAGQPWFKLGIRVINAGERPSAFAYLYGDEPWVGTFGSADGNVGWTSDGLVLVEAKVDPRAHLWAGIYDEKSRIADFVGWMGGDVPNLVYFSNSPGSVRLRPGVPLSSNEIFIGLEWESGPLMPAGSHSYLLTLGLAPVDALGIPHLPPGVGR